MNQFFLKSCKCSFGLIIPQFSEVKNWSPSLPLSSSSSLASFSLYLTLNKISSLSFGKGSLIHHIFAFYFHPWSAILGSSKHFPSIFCRYLQKDATSCYVLLISKWKELKYRELCFHSDIFCNISQAELHFFSSNTADKSSSFVKSSSDAFKSFPSIANMIWNLELPYNILKHAAFPFLMHGI